MSKVLIPLATGFEEIEAMTLVDILRRGEIEVHIASLEHHQVEGAHGVVVKADLLLDKTNASEYDMILLPGGLPGAEHLAKSDKVKQILQEFNSSDKLIGAICAAPWALGEAGVLKSQYTCYPGFEKQVGKAGYTDAKPVITDENIMTSRGPATAMEFALEIVKRLQGESKYQEVKAGLLY